MSEFWTALRREGSRRRVNCDCVLESELTGAVGKIAVQEDV